MRHDASHWRGLSRRAGGGRRAGTTRTAGCRLHWVRRPRAVAGPMTSVPLEQRAPFTDLATTVLEQVGDAVLVTDTAMDPGPRILYVNPAFTALTGWRLHEVVGRTPRLLRAPDSEPEAVRRVRAAMVAGRPVRAVLMDRRRDGRPLQVEVDVRPVLGASGLATHFVTVQREVREPRTRSSRFSDPLTGLLNRAGVERALTGHVRAAGRAGPPAVLMVCDVRGLRRVNSSYGRVAGDLVLQELGRRLVSLAPDAQVGRLDDAEFALLFDRASLGELVTVAERLRRVMLTPVRLGSRDLTLSVSCGMTQVGSDSDAATALREADLALRAAKDRGGATYEFYEPDMAARQQRQLELEQDLREALPRAELLLEHQPIVDLADRRLTGAEALVRWQHGGGMMPPADFIPTAEHSGLILPIGSWVLHEACRQAAGWQHRLPGVGVSVNLSARQLAYPGLVPDVERALDVGLDPALLTLEITESALLEDPDAATTVLRRLRQRGVRLALDDFGTGFSSLSYLTRLPVHSIKIDKEFVDGVGTDSPARAVVRAVVTLAREVGGLRVVAEGVETAQQCDVLRELGCHAGQGFLFARPGPVEDLYDLAGRPPVAVPC